MSAAKYHKRRDAEPSAGFERDAILQREFRRDLVIWITDEPRIALRVMKMVEAILDEPFTGIGKPEPLKHRLRGEWSRRITEYHRLEYVVSRGAVHFVRARSHYES